MIIPGTRTLQVKQAAFADWAGAFGPLGVMASNMMSPRTAPQTPPTTAQPAAPKPATPTPQPVSSWRNAPGTMPQGAPQLQRKWGDGPATTAASLMMPLPFHMARMARNFFNPGRQQQQRQHHNPQKTNRATTQPSSPYETTDEKHEQRIQQLETPLTQEDRDNWQGGILPQSDLQRAALAEWMRDTGPRYPVGGREAWRQRRIQQRNANRNRA